MISAHKKTGGYKPATIVKPLAPIRELPANATRFCCNKCHPKIVIVPKYIYKLHVQEIPVPVFIKAAETVDKCPSDFQQIKNMCVRQVTQKGACPPSWIKVDDDTCLKVLKLRVKEEKCPKGFKLVNGNCVVDEDECKEDVVELVCPKGWKKVGPYHCKKVVECPKNGGWKWVKGVGCVRKPVTCPPGYKRVGKSKCIQIIYKCPPGFKYDKQKKACIKIRIVVKCPPGYKLLKGTKKCILRRCVNKKCKPRPTKGCPQGQVWKIRRGKCCASCVDCGCPSDFRAVCSNDGTTYANECIARCLGATIKRVGPCKPDEPPKEKCPPTWERDVPCEKKCLDKPFEPVCTRSGITLPNDCVAGCFNESVAYKGKCKKVQTCEAK